MVIVKPQSTLPVDCGVSCRRHHRTRAYWWPQAKLL